MRRRWGAGLALALILVVVAAPFGAAQKSPGKVGLLLSYTGVLALYGPDGFHPSSIGTFLAALEIYERISGRDVRTLPPRAFSNGQPLTLPEATIRLLQAAAHDANVAFPATAGAPQSGARTTIQSADHC